MRQEADLPRTQAGLWGVRIAVVALACGLISPGCVGPRPPRGLNLAPLEGESAEDFALRRRAAAHDLLAEAEIARQNGQFERTRELTQALIDSEDLPPDLAVLARRIAFRAAREELKTRLVRCEGRFATPHLSQGDPLEITFQVTNTSEDRELFIGFQSRLPGARGWDPLAQKELDAAAGVAQSLIHVTISQTEHALDGTLFDASFSRVISLDDDVILGPGETRLFPLRIDTAEFGLGRPSLRSIRAEARLWPAELAIGERRYPGTLDFASTECLMFPKGWEHLNDNPSERLHQAVLVKESPIHVPLAAALIEEDEREEAVEWLLSLLAREESQSPRPDVRAAITIALRILTGERPGNTPEDWLRWSRER